MSKSHNSLYSYMVDTETLGKGDDAVVTQVGIVPYDVKTFEILGKFSRYVSVVDGIFHGGTVDPDTVAFWKKEMDKQGWDANTRDEAFYNGYSIKDTAEEIQQFIDTTVYDYGREFLIDAQGILFDIPKIDRLMVAGGQKSFTSQTRYNRVEDCRSIVNWLERLFPDVVKGIRKETLKHFNAHDAVGDCLIQIEILSECYKFVSELNRGCSESVISQAYDTVENVNKLSETPRSDILYKEGK